MGGPVIRIQQIPSADEKKALAGTVGAPSDTNRYVTNQDPRLDNLGDDGDTGVQGDTGVAGTAGDTGFQGDTGLQGDTGIGLQGDTGADSTVAGPKGDTGIGVQGDTGISVKGDTGDSGLKGDTGSKGDTGTGIQGDTGVSGAQGDTGVGAQGDTGTGIQGDTGVSGDKGDTGDQGLKGDTGSAVANLDDLLDVTVPTPTTNHVLKWNGTEWVSAAYDYNFTFSVASFSDDQASPQLVGNAASLWKAIGAVNWTASYNNGTPDPTPHVVVSGYADSNLTGPNYTSGQNGVAYNYPSPDSTVTFTLHTNKGAVTDNSWTVTVTFNNYLRYGKTTTTSGWSSAEIMALVQSAISSGYTTVPGSGSVNAGASEYLLYAHPSRYTTLSDAGFRYGGVTCPFELAATISVTNDVSGTPLTENYKVYRSTNANLGQQTLLVSTTDQTINPIYWGLSPVDSGFTENDIKTLTGGSSTISNTKTRTFSLNAGAGERYIYALPRRINTDTADPVEIWVNGVDQTGGFTMEIVSVTNVNGYTENYDVYYSNNEALGAASVETK